MSDQPRYASIPLLKDRMTFSALVRMLVWSCFAVVASFTTNAVFGLTRADALYAYSLQSNDGAFVSPSRIQAVSKAQPFKSDPGRSRSGSANAAEDFGVTRPSTSSIPSSQRFPASQVLHHLDQSLNGPRAPPSI